MAAKLNIECPSCGGTRETNVTTTRKRYVAIDGKDQLPRRQVVVCGACACKFERIEVTIINVMRSGLRIAGDR